ncbi:glyoxalase/bleomycin resistance/extradiol dioxygenase family protein [Saxibacter everestensis]|uniref:Glyoxalase/bleomycin resistance/extradiol dioxygenase family protein n=1 Tax=Saxibacter everestensis TaxID=2909229 RepID=A0ABY8QNQ4_9MICO|nr:glyoxalase/bleomycin resistance/extradiol dioxygenase family protein [Brevibacteriaceae bacterium ZFBP1038]
MSATLATYVALPGNAADAFTHWQEVFGGELDLTRYGDMDLEGMPFTPDPEKVAHAALHTPGGDITGGDAMPGEDAPPLRDTAYSLLYGVDTPDEARTLIQKLVDGGGSVNMPFELAPWGDWYGQAFDRFGVMWAFAASESSGTQTP